jgi:hypothetical protein
VDTVCYRLSLLGIIVAGLARAHIAHSREAVVR